MEPEREVVNWWLNRRGFFTVNNIKASQNKEIGTLALKFDETGSRIQHIEVNCSISTPTNLTLDRSSPEKSVDIYVERKFDNEVIINKVRNSVRKLTGKEMDYEKAIVLGNIAHANRERIIKLLEKKGVIVYKFEDILQEVMENLDKQNYQNATIRNLQLVKHILMSSPVSLAGLLNHSGNYSIFNLNTREEFLRNLLSDSENQRIIQKELNEQIIIDLLRKSSLKRPERLAQVLSESVLSSRSGKRFLGALEERGFKVRKIKKKKEMPLLKFLKVK